MQNRLVTGYPILRNSLDRCGGTRTLLIAPNPLASAEGFGALRLRNQAQNP